MKIKILNMRGCWLLVDQLQNKWKGMIILTDEAKNARREYMRRWRLENHLCVREYNRNWRKANPDKVKSYRESYWERKAEQNQTEGGAV